MKSNKYILRAFVLLYFAIFVLSACQSAPLEPIEEHAEMPTATVQEAIQPSVFESHRSYDRWSRWTEAGKRFHSGTGILASGEKAFQEIVEEFNRTNEWGITVVAENLRCR